MREYQLLGRPDGGLRPAVGQSEIQSPIDDRLAGLAQQRIGTMIRWKPDIPKGWPPLLPLFFSPAEQLDSLQRKAEPFLSILEREQCVRSPDGSNNAESPCDPIVLTAPDSTTAAWGLADLLRNHYKWVAYNPIDKAPPCPDLPYLLEKPTAIDAGSIAILTGAYYRLIAALQSAYREIGIAPKQSAKKPQSKHIQAWFLLQSGYTEGRVAEMLKTTQGNISKWKSVVELWLADGNKMPEIEKTKPLHNKPQSMDPDKLEWGARVDHRPEHQRESEKASC